MEERLTVRLDALDRYRLRPIAETIVLFRARAQRSSAAAIATWGGSASRQPSKCATCPATTIRVPPSHMSGAGRTVVGTPGHGEELLMGGQRCHLPKDS